MNIWLIAEGEDLPVIEKSRLMRMGALAKYLSKKGHYITWWSSTFIHGSKEYYCKAHKEVQINENELLILLHSKIAYKRNISLRRILYHKILARELWDRCKEKAVPDIILCAWPTPQFASVAIRYGKIHSVPVIIDARDMWPDIFERAFPDKIRFLGKAFLWPLKKSAAKSFKSADGITGMIDSVLKWACNYAGRIPGENDKTIYIGNEKIHYSEDVISECTEWWERQGIKTSDWIICFFSTFGSHIAVDTVIRAVKELSAQYPEIKLVLGGGGDREKELRNIAGDCHNIVFAGWLDNLQMTTIMQMAKCGAFCIKNTFDFKDTFNNKAIQYISEGLPILNSLSGFAKSFISDNNFGLTYECDSVADCKAKILQLYSDEEARGLMGRNGLQCFEEMFESDVVNEQFEDYLIRMSDKYKSIRSVR